MTFAGAAYLVGALLLPEVLIAYAKVPYYFAGASVLIVVCAVLDIEAQVRSYSHAGRGTTTHETDSSRTAGGG
jgi:preprotein translocase subunit SecY